MQPTRLSTLLRSGLLLASGAACGCTLIDQKTFAPDPEPPTASQIASSSQPDRRVPLLMIRYDVPNPAYEEPLRTAIQAARQRNPNFEFDVVAVAPGAGGAPNAATAVLAARDDALDVMRTMIRLGIPAQSIRLAARTDAAVAVREVRVYVR